MAARPPRAAFPGRRWGTVPRRRPAPISPATLPRHRIRHADQDRRLIAREEPIDGAILDINLKRELVYPLAQVLRERAVPYVFTTGYAASSIAEVEPDAPCFEKPVVAAQLIAALFERDKETPVAKRHK